MKALMVYATSRGKNERNDDFVLHRSILNSRVLCVLGDFTSDSPKGANLRLQASLETFIEKRIATWREHLIPPQDILHLLAKFINSSLADGKNGEKTTLFACIIDSYDREFYFVNIGDSGFGLASEGGFTFLRKGDVGGARDASGFLPLETEQFDVLRSHFPQDARLLAFTDGFWENTAHVLSPNQAEARLAPLLSHASLAEIAQVLETQILSQSNHRDDLTLILVKEEPVTDIHGDSQQTSSAQLQAVIDQKVLEALDRQERMRPMGPSPMEAEFLSLLKSSSAGLNSIERRITEKVQQENEQMHQRLLSQLQSQLGQIGDQIAQLAEQVKDQKLTFKARVANAVSESTRDLRQLRDLAPLPDQLNQASQRIAVLEKTLEQAQVSQLNQVNLAQMQRRLKSLESRNNASSAVPSHAESESPKVVSARISAESETGPWWKQRHLLWNALHSGLLVFILGWLLISAWRSPETSGSGDIQNPVLKLENAISSSEKTLSGMEQLRAMAMAGNMPEVVWPDGLGPLETPGNLTHVMGLTTLGFRQEMLTLAKTLAREKDAIAAAESTSQVTERLPLSFGEGVVAGKSSLPLFLRSTSNSPPNGTKLNGWLTEYVKSPNLYPPKEHLLGLWLQMHAGINVIDGDFGQGSQKKLTEVLQKRVNLNAVSALIQALGQPTVSGDSSLQVAELTQKINALLNLANTGELQADAQSLKDSLRDGQPLQIGGEIWILPGAAPYRQSPLLLAKSEALTPLGEAYLQIRQGNSADERTLLLAILANRLGLAHADGDPSLILQILNGLRGKSHDQVILEGKAKA